ncbi:hypothetical protein, partial [Acidisphaera rubrifaciens]|uniref:hypothetical protein n=1 Tax=Acidisphaera rubrifaciens TaxID=50715 RepID=UPI000662404A
MSDTISVTGDVTSPLTLGATGLAALPQTTVAVAVNGQPESFSGVSVYTLISDAGFTSPAGKNGQLHDDVQVSNGTTAVALSEGELDPAFGGAQAATTDIIATTEDGHPIAPQLIVPGDANGGIAGRDIAGVTTLTVGQASVPTVPITNAVTTSFTLGGAVAVPGTYTVAALEALPATTQTDTFQAGPSTQRDTFTGTTLFGLLATVGLTPAAQANLLDDVVVVTGSDGYAVTYSLGELAR